LNINKMSRFEKGQDGAEYLIKDKGEITADDPVGKYLLSRFERDPKSKTKLVKSSKKFATYSSLLEDYEQGRMTRGVYEELMGRVGYLQTSFTEERAQRRASSLITQNREIIGELFGRDEDALRKQEELTKVYTNSEDFWEHITDYIEKRINEVPQSYRERLTERARKRDAKGLEKALNDLRYVTDFNVKYSYENELRWQINRDVSEKYSRLFSRGSVFDFYKFTTTLPEIFKQRTIEVEKMIKREKRQKKS
jgi:hypothetical protein